MPTIWLVRGANLIIKNESSKLLLIFFKKITLKSAE